ncbi:MAG: rod shape-determining protein RodA [Chroococcidiopsidaceae cyanobacterium CP_BM_RX_35]|nr:rod shape-determining protein RodA [Chroococcidiopsidaceae cyanobacterium CP_BM_RX_35]
MLQASLKSLRWKYLIAPWQEVDWSLFALSAAVMVFGGIMIRSAELSQGLNDWWQQWLFGCFGLALALFIARYRYENLIQWHWIIYGITNISLVAVMVMGIHAKGAQRWISIAGFNFQPSEFAKLGVIVTLAALLQSQTASQLSTVLRALAVTAVPWALVFLQPDLGTSLVFGAIALGMLYWGNAHPGWLVLLISPVVAAILFNTYLPAWLGWASAMSLIAFSTLPWRRVGAMVAITVNLVAGELGQIFWKLLKPYQKDRLILFLDPDKDPLGGGYHLIQSRIAIGAGGLWGQGLGHGTQTQLNFIPEQHTDFIFSAVGEELGFVGCLAVLCVFWLICLRLIVVAHNAKDNFGSLLAIGVLSMLVFQVIINIGMTIGLAPVTGIPLPWISYGRSALLTNFIAIGIVESVANHRQRLKF